MTEKTGIRISPRDNVVTVVEETGPEDRVRYATPAGDRQVTPVQQIPAGHKVAVEDVPEGGRIVKYDQTIGTASVAVRRGEHVHVHNVRSAVQGVESES